MDFYANPDEIKAFMPVIDCTWKQYWSECNEIALKRQDGYVDWLSLWSAKPMVTVECDMSVMISPEQFDEFFLPSLKRQIEFVDRSIYHLDGTGQIRHLDTLLSLERLTGIQWIPESTNIGIKEMLPMFKRVKDAGKLLVLTSGVKSADVRMLLDELGPEGVSIFLHCKTPEEADALVESL